MNNYYPGLQSEGKEASKTKQTTLDSFSTKSRAKLSQSSKRYRKITQGIATFIACDVRPVAAVEGCGFVELLEFLEPAYTVPSRKHIISVLREILGEVKAQVGEQIRSAEYVSLMMDFWTSHAVQS